LRLKYDEVINRIHKRGRDSEQQVDDAYWKDLYFQYYENEKIHNYIRENTKNFIVLDIDDMSEEEVVDAIIEKIGK
jgi:deoxyadenosine/deoxycytidine kinase